MTFRCLAQDVQFLTTALCIERCSSCSDSELMSMSELLSMSLGAAWHGMGVRLELDIQDVVEIDVAHMPLT